MQYTPEKLCVNSLEDERRRKFGRRSATPEHQDARGQLRNLENVTATRYMYHDLPFTHEKYDPLAVVNKLMNGAQNGVIAKNDRCCGESGTLAAARPDVSTQARFRRA